MFALVVRRVFSLLLLIQVFPVVFSSLPFHCGFEEIEGQCGMKGLDGDHFIWLRGDLNTSNVKSYSGVSHILIQTTGRRTVGDRATIMTPPLGHNGTVCVRFAYYDFDNYVGKLQMMTSHDGIFWEVLWSSDGVENSTWTAVTYNYYRSRPNTLIAFLGLVRRTRGEIAIDDVNITSGCCDQITCSAIPPKNASIWSAWNPWSRCSKGCGDGFSQRERFCIEQQLGGVCNGANFERRNCSLLLDCPAIWGEWLSWGICDSDCGVGFKRRRRDCKFLWPTQKTCVGDDWQGTVCIPADCKRKSTCPANCNSCYEDVKKCDKDKCRQPYLRLSLTGLCVQPKRDKPPQIWKSVVLFGTVTLSVGLLAWMIRYLTSATKDDEHAINDSTRSNYSSVHRSSSKSID